MIKEYIHKNKERFLDELFELLRIESVSADSKFKKEVDKAADWLVGSFCLYFFYIIQVNLFK